MTHLRKVPNELNDGLDNLFYEVSDRLSEHLRKIKGMSPNVITTMGMLFGILGLVMLYHNKITYSIIFLWLYYFSDCLDGLYARKYNMETKFGDYYDHFRDLSIGILYVYFVYKKIKSKNLKSMFLFTIILLSILASVYLGCQERVGELYPEYRNVSPVESSPSLSYINKYFCTSDPVKTLRYMKYFSPSTMIIFISITMIFLKP